MNFETEHLAEDHENTSAENDMSLILLLQVGGSKVLFTGDSGTRGLFEAIKFAMSKNISLKDLDIFHVPHHGSKHNLSKGILKYIGATYGFISCAKKGEPKHPSEVVTNSLWRRNIKPYLTKESLLTYHNDLVPKREEFFDAIPFPFSYYTEIDA